MRKILLKDIVIPAGTIFEEAPSKSIQSEGHIETTIRLTKDSFGDLTYYLDKNDPELDEWFGDKDLEWMKANTSSDKPDTKYEYKPIPIEKWADILTQRVALDNGKYVINNLHAHANKLTTKSMPMEHLNIYDLKVGDSTVKEFAKHMKAVFNTNLDYPIILDEEGYVMDGRHRIVKALFKGETYIKFVRFEKTPEPDYYEDKDES